MSKETIPAEHPYVARQDGICGGRAAVRGTRIAVWNIALSYQAGATIDEMMEDWPHLGAAQLFDALSYYHDHTSAIEADIADNRATAKVLLPARPRKVGRARRTAR